MVSRETTPARTKSFVGSLLVATPTLQDPNFDRTVVIGVGHESDGVLGVGPGPVRRLAVRRLVVRGRRRSDRVGSVLLDREQGLHGGRLLRGSVQASGAGTAARKGRGTSHALRRAAG